MQAFTGFVNRLLVVSLTALMTVCGSESPPTGGAASPSAARVAAIVTLTSSDCSLVAASGPVKEGLVAFTLENQSGVKAGVDIWLMPDDRTFDQLVASAAEDRRLAEAGEPSVGDHSSLGDAPQLRLPWDASASQTGSAFLKSGTYAVVCIKSYPKVAEPRLLKVIGPVVIGPA